ncbi:cytochrome c peroxidase [Pelagibius sp. Alg239-R121]|uniref:cytochrome-c peroxidase n=1 Tax=Pelagibius sp. Alg239-R121 TaxID=2993448 RepID=UPI002AC36102|nr:cytochrome c peroxidase [Pelagibius sp. Alg239-R121]
MLKGTRQQLLRVLSLVAAFAMGGEANAAKPSGDVYADLKAQYARPLYIPFPSGTPYSPQLATLGKMLFFDPRLSSTGSMNCVSCHTPSFGYEAPVEQAVGAGGQALPRHANTLLNMAWVAPLFWDGRAANLEQQAVGPITSPLEMAGDFDDIVAQLSEIEEYRSWFDKLFPDEGVSRDSILTAIATYERTIVSGWAPFDRWVDGDEDAVGDDAKRGFAVFNGKAQCSNCHTGWNFTDNAFHDIGMGDEDRGRGVLDADSQKAQYAFKTPGLRDLTLRAPFMHNGALADLESVIMHYESGGMGRPSASPMMQPFELTDDEREDLLAFLRSLTAEISETAMPILPN